MECHSPVAVGSLVEHPETLAILRTGERLLRTSVRQHRRAHRRYLWPYGGWLGFHAAVSCTLLNERHPRPVNAYVLGNQKSSAIGLPWSTMKRGRPVGS